MEWKDVGDIVKKIAPAAEGLLATFGGPPGMIAAGAIKAVTSVFGLDESATPDVLIQAISADPQAALKLAMANQDFTLKQRDQDIEVMKAQLSDVQNARQRQVDVTKATGRSDNNLYVLAWVIMCGFFGTILGLIFLKMYYPAVNTSDATLSLLLGSLSTDAGMVVGYFFGSSRGSDSKNTLLAAR